MVYIDTTTLEAWQKMKRWYVVRSKHRNEVLLWHQLCSRGIEAYFPRIYTHGRMAPLGVVKPLFPRFLFVHIDLAAGPGSALLWMPGADGFVCFGGKPAFVSDCVLRGIEERADQGNQTVRGAPSELHPGIEIERDNRSFGGYGWIFDTRRPERERAAGFLQFIHDQQVHGELPGTPLTLTRGYRPATAASYLPGLRSTRRDAPPWRRNSAAKNGDGVRLEAVREEVSPPG